MPDGSHQEAQARYCRPGYITQSYCVNYRVRYCRYFQLGNCARRPVGRCWGTSIPCGGACSGSACWI